MKIRGSSDNLMTDVHQSYRNVIDRYAPIQEVQDSYSKYISDIEYKKELWQQVYNLCERGITDRDEIATTLGIPWWVANDLVKQYLYQTDFTDNMWNNVQLYGDMYSKNNFAKNEQSKITRGSTNALFKTIQEEYHDYMERFRPIEEVQKAYDKYLLDVDYKKKLWKQVKKLEDQGITDYMEVAKRLNIPWYIADDLTDQYGTMVDFFDDDWEDNMTYGDYFKKMEALKNFSRINFKRDRKNKMNLPEEYRPLVEKMGPELAKELYKAGENSGISEQARFKVWTIVADNVDNKDAITAMKNFLSNPVKHPQMAIKHLDMYVRRKKLSTGDSSEKEAKVGDNEEKKNSGLTSKQVPEKNDLKAETDNKDSGKLSSSAPEDAFLANAEENKSSKNESKEDKPEEKSALSVTVDNKTKEKLDQMMVIHPDMKYIKEFNKAVGSTSKAKGLYEKYANAAKYLIQHSKSKDTWKKGTDGYNKLMELMQCYAIASKVITENKLGFTAKDLFATGYPEIYKRRDRIYSKIPPMAVTKLYNKTADELTKQLNGKQASQAVAQMLSSTAFLSKEGKEALAVAKEQGNDVADNFLGLDNNNEEERKAFSRYDGLRQLIERTGGRFMGGI